VCLTKITLSARARDCLSVIASTLVGRLGLRTLDPCDMQYRAVYDNANDSDDRTTAGGFNYHQVRCE
jgi:glycogen debranching enzyme